MDEEVVDIQVQRHGGPNIVCLSAVDDTTGIIKDEPGHDHYDCCRDGQ